MKMSLVTLPPLQAGVLFVLIPCALNDAQVPVFVALQETVCASGHSNEAVPVAKFAIELW